MKNYKIRVTKKTSAQVQKACFAKNIKWAGGLSKVQSVISPYLYVEDRDILGIPSNKQIEFVILYGNNEAGFEGSPNTEISAEDFIELLNTMKGQNNVSEI